LTPTDLPGREVQQLGVSTSRGDPQADAAKDLAGDKTHRGSIMSTEELPQSIDPEVTAPMRTRNRRPPEAGCSGTRLF
jgi:hypothetical protein